MRPRGRRGGFEGLRARPGRVVTFSIAARCPRSGQFGVAVASSAPAAAARSAHARAGVGAVTSQNVTDPRLGPRGLDLLADGLDAKAALGRLCEESGEEMEYRQVAVVDAKGRVACFSGVHALGIHASAEGPGVVAAGHMLAGPDIPSAMLARYSDHGRETLGDRLVAALVAGLEAGGEMGPVYSAGLLIVANESWPVTDLRVDWSRDPIHRLAELWTLWKPQAGDHVTRALDPSAAPPFGVPGDE